ncbi:MAG: prepilin-type N-terminal cleavage/methylation domain-containing protein [Lachnospiraceae bacterium]|nr:prepilin-type N-terminal cleavage/methylation domain-containing protein [Lachnospiraceae bacterium]
MKKNNNKGFSLVELIIVIAIMAILVGIMAPQLLKYIEKANVSADTQLLDSVYNAVVYASVDPDVVADPDSQSLLNAMRIPLQPLKLEDLDDGTGNRFCEEVLSTLGWSNLQPSTYREMLQSAHGSGATIYFTYQGDFVNPIIMWITTTDITGKKDTNHVPSTYDESNASVMGEIRSCIHIE